MRMTRLFGMMALACLLAVQLAGCATMKMTSRRLCESGGGTYANKTCTPGKTMKAEEMCQSQAGSYNPSDDTCELPTR
jgi:hypothetical protein